ncbi:MAG: MBL fold metallo-hydrolase [Gammaproteobacteria bacterium]|nr:MBL fold metallo-hydrolase [Gammaproteobacteria bacterium]
MPEHPAHITELGNGICAIDTDYMRPLLDASHLIVEKGRGAYVDTGVNHSVPLLLEALRQHNLDPGDVDFVFLTHIHLDHAGGAGLLMQHLPKAIAVLHPRGAPHMIDPSKLIKGSQAVYGEALYKKVYGDIVPIAKERILIVDDEQTVEFAGRPMQCLFTEGHARHHYCLADPASRGVFTGDSFGISYRELDTARGEFIYPTTTPVHFDPREAHRAIDRIMAQQPEQLFLTHYSRVTDLERLANDMHRRIDDFVAIALQYADQADRTGAMHRRFFEYFRGELEQHGFHGDDDRLHAIIDVDIELNTMGLEYWLDHDRQ